MYWIVGRAAARVAVGGGASIITVSRVALRRILLVGVVRGTPVAADGCGAGVGLARLSASRPKVRPFRGGLSPAQREGRAGSGVGVSTSDAVARPLQ